MASVRDDVREGMRVYTADGVEIGEVFKLDAEHFIITRGTWLPVDYLCNYAHVKGVTEAVYLDETLEQVREGLAVEPELREVADRAEREDRGGHELLEEGFDSDALTAVAAASDREGADRDRLAPGPDESPVPLSDEELARRR